MDLKGMIRDVPDFPKPGIVYKDITPILSDGAALRYVIDSFADRYRGRIDAVAGIESRGFEQTFLRRRATHRAVERMADQGGIGSSVARVNRETQKIELEA